MGDGLGRKLGWSRELGPACYYARVGQQRGRGEGLGRSVVWAGWAAKPSKPGLRGLLLFSFLFCFFLFLFPFLYNKTTLIFVIQNS